MFTVTLDLIDIICIGVVVLSLFVTGIFLHQMRTDKTIHKYRMEYAKMMVDLRLLIGLSEDILRQAEKGNVDKKSFEMLKALINLFKGGRYND